MAISSNSVREIFKVLEASDGSIVFEPKTALHVVGAK
jgi:hypothetical protein